MRIFLVVCFLSLLAEVATANEDRSPGSIRQKWHQSADKDSLALFQSLGLFFADSVQFDSARYWFRRAEYFSLRNEQPARASIALKKQGSYYLQQGYTDSAQATFTRALALDRTLDKPTLLAASLNNIGLIYYYNGDYRAGARYVQESRQLYRELGNDSLLAISLLNLGIEYKRMGYLDIASAELEEGLKVIGASGKDLIRAYLLNTLANTRRSQGDPSTALPLHRQALKIRIRLGKKPPIANSYNNLGNTFLDLEELDSAQAYLNKALVLKQAIGNPRSEASTQRNLGRVAMKLSEWNVAESRFQQALQLSLTGKNTSGAAESANFLAELYQQTRQYELLDSVLRLGEQWAESSGDGDVWLANLELQKARQQDQGNLKQALMLGERYLVIRDSLKGKGDQRALGEVIIAYENARDQYEKDLLIRDRKRAIAGGIAVILILSVFFYLRNRYKQKALKVLQGKNQEIEARNHQIELLFRELNHRVKNNLMVISSLLKLQARQLTDEGARSAIQESRNRVEAMGLIHQKLYQNAQISHIRLSDYLRKLVPNLLASYGFSTQSVDLEMEIADMEITVDTAVPLGLVVNELVSNAFKYAYKNVDAPWLKVSLQPQGEQLELLVQDNGPGLPEEFNNRREGSFGLKLVHSLTRQMRGKLTISNRPGACFQLLVQDTPKNANKPSDG